MISKRHWGIGYLAGTGSSLVVLIAWWFALDGDAGVTAFVATVTGVVLSLSLVYLAYWLTQSDLGDEHIWAVSRWGAIGLAIPTVPIVLLAFAGSGAGVRSEPIILLDVAAACAVIGALFGAVTELETEHGRLLSANERIVALNRLLRHDVRNDAGVLLMLADNLEDQFEAAGDRFADPIRRKTDELVELSEVARRVESLERDGSTRPVDVVDVVEGVVRAARATRPAAEVETDLPDAAWVAGDQVIRSVIDNLVENAIEHNDREPTVRITVRRPDPGGDRVEVVVADDGPGIPEATVRALSSTGSSDPDDPPPGTGLGLWLVRWFVDACDGELAIERIEPRGTAVRLRLPRAEPREEPLPTVEVPT